MAIAVREITKGKVPKFAVEALKGTRTRESRTWDKEKKSFVDGKQEVEGGYKLMFPKGHWIVVDTMKEVERLVGDPENVEIIDMENSEIVGQKHVPLKTKGNQ